MSHALACRKILKTCRKLDSQILANVVPTKTPIHNNITAGLCFDIRIAVMGTSAKSAGSNFLLIVIVSLFDFI